MWLVFFAGEDGRICRRGRQRSAKGERGKRMGLPAVFAEYWVEPRRKQERERKGKRTERVKRHLFLTEDGG
uniref:Putative ovule protein n=1 Tax=Solanum chacoense TaxID=4108 RepID=A0A0V0GLD4_SOLCH